MTPKSTFRGKAATRASTVADWMDSFSDLYDAIDEVFIDLDVTLGEPRVEYGPSYVRSRYGGSGRVRLGAVWVCGEVTTGFCVTFTDTTIDLDVRHGGRRASVHTELCEPATLTRHLRLGMELVGFYEASELNTT